MAPLYGFLAAVFIVGVWGPASAQTDRTPPDVVRALYVRLLVQQITWPQIADIRSQPSLNICIAGDKNELNTELYEDGKDKPPLRAVALEDKSRKFITENCHVLYISSDFDQPAMLLERAKDAPVLTISSIKKFVRKGGMLGLVPYGDSIRFTVNIAALNGAGLRMNPDSLALAVEDPG